MTRTIKVLGALAVLGGAAVLSQGVFAAKTPPPVKVRASFVGLTNSAYPPDSPEFYVDKLHNDALGSYVTTTDIKVHITADVGDFVFEIPHHSGRNVLVVFPQASAAGEDLPDTAGIYPAEDDPVDYFVFRTFYGLSADDVRLNFLTMTPGVAKPVRLWNWLCTSGTHDYHIKYDNPDLYHDGGIVEVTAYDDNGDSQLDRWVITPLPVPDDWAWITRIDRKVKIDFGSWPMPFTLILERL